LELLQSSRWLWTKPRVEATLGKDGTRHKNTEGVPSRLELLQSSRWLWTKPRVAATLGKDGTRHKNTEGVPSRLELLQSSRWLWTKPRVEATLGKMEPDIRTLKVFLRIGTPSEFKMALD
jgi:hypothetical protein